MAEPRKRFYPLPDPDLVNAFVVLPPRWLGEHAKRRDEAIEAARKYNSETFTSFAVSLALCENWNLPGLDGKPEAWDFSKLPLQLIAWVNDEVLSDFGRCFIVPKGLSQPLVIGLIEPLIPTNTAGG